MAEEATAESSTTQTTPEAAAAGSGTAETKTQDKAGAGQEAKATEKQDQTQTEKPNLKPADFFRQREDKREKKAQDRVAELEKKISELEKARPASQAEAPVAFIDDPDKWAQGVSERAEQRALDAIEHREAVARFNQSAGKAVAWLLTRSHIREDVKLANDVRAVVQERYQHIFQVDPEVAIEKAYMAVCEAKGISPDMGAFKKDSLNASGGTSTSGARASAAAGGKRVFNRGEGDKYVMAGGQPGSEEYMRRLSEVEEARKDGRIR